METKQAVQVLKQVIDQSIQSGVFKNAESVSVVLQAFQVLLKDLGIDGSQKS